MAEKKKRAGETHAKPAAAKGAAKPAAKPAKGTAGSHKTGRR